MLDSIIWCPFPIIQKILLKTDTLHNHQTPYSNFSINKFQTENYNEHIGILKRWILFIYNKYIGLLKRQIQAANSETLIELACGREENIAHKILLLTRHKETRIAIMNMGFVSSKIPNKCSHKRPYSYLQRQFEEAHKNS